MLHIEYPEASVEICYFQLKNSAQGIKIAV